MHIIFLAHKAGVLDGLAAGNRAIAATEGSSYYMLEIYE